VIITCARCRRTMKAEIKVGVKKVDYFKTCPLCREYCKARGVEYRARKSRGAKGVL